MPTPHSQKGPPPANDDRWSGLAASLAVGAAIGAWTASLISRRPEQAKDPLDGGMAVKGNTAFGAPAVKAPPSVQMERALQTGRGRTATHPWHIPWRGWKDILLRTYQQINEDRLTSVAAGVVFLGLLAIFPAISAIVSLYGLFADPKTVNEHLAALWSSVPHAAYSVIQDQITRVVSKSDGKLSFAFGIGLLLAIWSANAGMKAIIDSLNVAYEEKEKRGFIKLNLVSLAFTFGAILFALLAVAAVVVFPLILERIGLSDFSQIIVSWLRWPAFLAIILIGLSILYRYGPSRRLPRWQWISVGSVFAAILWIVASSAFSLYLSDFAHYDVTYGTLGAGIGLMMWMWVSMIVILVGAELNAEIEHQTAADTTVGHMRPLGERGAVVADTVGKSVSEKA